MIDVKFTLSLAEWFEGQALTIDDMVSFLQMMNGPSPSSAIGLLNKVMAWFGERDLDYGEMPSLIQLFQDSGEAPEPEAAPVKKKKSGKTPVNKGGLPKGGHQRGAVRCDTHEFKKLRESKGLDRGQLSEKTGISKTTILDVENGNKEYMSAKTAQALFAFFKLPPPQ